MAVRARAAQTRRRAALLRLLPAEGGPRAHYRITYGNHNNDFILNKRDGVWALRLRKHLKPHSTLEEQLELEAR